MLLSGNTSISNTLPYHYLSKRSKRFTTVTSRKSDSSNVSKTKKKPTFELKFPSKILAQTAIGVLGLGFVDAGYSGDWSRIGVISKEFEDLLKIAAFIVVPLCLFLIFSINIKVEE